ncbi:unnamed protein product [Durusdinium trenchii]|uniref:Uncharacterized protein n=1 Tax=Durusdinium trenchii TaxID=1381693 RepID=A0ABP0QTP1_9DINO
MAEAAPMQVDADEGMLLYVSLLREVLTSQGLMVPGSTLMLAEKQLSIYHLAARLQDLRDPLLTFWRTGEESEALEEPFVSSIKKVKQVWQQEGRWNCNLKAKKVFGHPQAVKFLSLPDFPSSVSSCCVFLPKRPSVGEGDALWSFTAGCGNDPIADLETKGFGLVLRMDKFMKDAIVLVSPSLQRSSEELSKLILREPDVWRRLLKTEHDLFNPPSASFVKQVLRSATATVTPQKPRPAGPEDHTPEKEMDKSKAKNEDPGPKAYAKLLEAMLQELDFFAEPFQGLRWLENKKQLLVYHYAARMNEQKDAILQMIQGVEAEDRLEPVYARAVKAVKEELMGLFSEGHKFKKMFSHDHVIRFHTLKGLPVPRENCVFLRERPQCTGDVLRKTPSIFRDLIRYRGQTSPLMELEHHHLALVFTVTDRNPRAWLVISPLLSKPELVEKVCQGTWSEIEEQLKEELSSLIRQESDVWRNFIQRHADMVSKDSLKIIQKVLKGCQPGSGLGAFTMRFAEDVDEACQARELAEMRFAEAEQRWDMSAQLALADAETRRLDIEKKAKQWKSRAKQQEAALEVEQQQAEEQLSTLQKSHRDEVSRLYKDCEEAKRSLAHQELRCLQLAEEAELLQDSKQELLHAVAKLDAEERKDRRSWRRKNAVLKQHLKQSKKEQKELLAKTKADAEAKLSDVQLAVSEEAAQLRLQLAEAQSAQRASLAQLEVQTAALQRTVQLNTELRTSIAKAEDEAKASYKVATATRAAELEARAALEASRKELESAQEASGKELKEAEARHVEATKALQKAKAENDAAREEVAHLTETCRGLRVDAAKATLLEREKISIEEQLSQASHAQSKLAKRIEAAEQTEQKLREELLQREVEVKNKIETLEHLQARNRSLQVTSAEAAEREAEASMRLKESEAKLKEESAMASAAQAALASAREAAEDAKTRCIKAEELERAANAKRSQAEELQKEAETRAQEAQEARVTTQQQYLQSKAQLQSQRNEAKHLTERCSQLSYEKAQAEKRADGEKVSKEQAQQSLLAKQAEFEVVQETVKAVQESNRTLREDCAALRAKSMEALTLSEEAQRLAEAARKQRLAAEEEVSMSKKAARLAEDKLGEVLQKLEVLQNERQSIQSDMAKLQKTCAEKEKEAEQALEEKRKAASRLIAQDAEAQSLSRACAALKGDVAAGRRREEALEQRAKQAEAEMRRLVAEMATEPDRLEAELDALVDAQSPDKPPDMTDAPPAMAARSEDEAPAKKPRIDQGSQPSKRIRCKSKDPGL